MIRPDSSSAMTARRGVVEGRGEAIIERNHRPTLPAGRSRDSARSTPPGHGCRDAVTERARQPAPLRPALPLLDALRSIASRHAAPRAASGRAPRSLRSRAAHVASASPPRSFALASSSGLRFEQVPQPGGTSWNRRRWPVTVHSSSPLRNTAERLAGCTASPAPMRRIGLPTPRPRTDRSFAPHRQYSGEIAGYQTRSCGGTLRGPRRDRDDRGAQAVLASNHTRPADQTVPQANLNESIVLARSRQPSIRAD